jgi:hypothetical protein
MRPHLVLLVLMITASTACITDNSCGRTRSVSAQGTNPQARPSKNLVTVILGQAEGSLYDDRYHTISWDVPVQLGGDPISAVHIHNRDAEHDDGILYVFPHEAPDGHFIPESSTIYEYPTPMRVLFDLTRAGQTYVDIHTAGHPEGTARADLTSVVDYKDWVNTYCD